MSLKIQIGLLVWPFVYFETRQVNSKVHVEIQVRISE